MKKKKLCKKILAGVLSMALVIGTVETIPGVQVTTSKAATIPEAAYKWTFEDVTGTDVANAGTVSEGKAKLRGTAKVQQETLQVADKSYSDSANHVMVLSGGSKGSSYADLPNDLYSGINSDTGLTWSFWMKTSSNVASYSRLFSSTDSSNKNEFAFAPYAQDSVWNLIFDDGASYRHTFSEEPDKGVWSLITITISSEEVQFYKNGLPVESNAGSDASLLEGRLDSLSTLVNNALGRTYSTWSDSDCAVSLDDVCLYKTILTPAQIKEVAVGYGLDVTEQEPPKEEISYDDGSEGLTEIEALRTVSKDSSNVVRIWKDSSNCYYYSAYRNNTVTIQCSPLGVVTKGADLSTGLVLDETATKKTEGKEEYDWVQGSSSHVSKEYTETSFTMSKGNSKITMIFRVFNDGMAYRYEIDGNVTSDSEVTEVTGEDSSFVLPDSGTIWTMGTSMTYEASTYSPRKMKTMASQSGDFAPPILGKIPTDNGACWVLLAEANVYNEQNPYCASVFQTKSGSKALQVKFGRYLEQEQDTSYDKKTYSPTYAAITSVKMTDVFHTPWRLAIMTDNLEGITNSSLVSDLNPAAEGDFSWVKPGTSSWSWWSTNSDAIDYDTMYDYIDYAKETGQQYCLVDFGWELWKDYETKIKDLVAYAQPKGVDLILWYGVNKFDQSHIFDLDNEETIEEQFAWCEKMGVKGVKVDYLNSDSQFAMKVMYDLASIAAKHKLVINYHGCTDPNGENRTFPNILSSEAVMGAEYFKWGSGSPVQSLLTLPYTRNVLGSMEFTPIGMSVKNVSATNGFMLAMPIVYESAVQTLAHSAYVYQGYKGASLLSYLPSSWDESKLIDGYPGSSVIRARRKGENWYLGAMTKLEASYTVPLDFLDKGDTYYAYIYKDNEAGTDLEVSTQLVNSDTVLQLDLQKAGGCAIKFSKNDPMTTTIYDGYHYYEAENASLGTGTQIKETDYVSGKKFVDSIGGNAAKKITFENVNVLEGGPHELKIFLVSPTKRALYVKVNDEEPVMMSSLVGVAGDGQAVSSKSITVNLKAGNNTICLYNASSLAPGIDRIAVSKSDISNAVVTLEKNEYAYSGGRNTPAVTVTRNGATLKEGEDYNVYYSNCVQAGTASVTVIGIGGYAGVLKKDYTITSPSVAGNNGKVPSISGSNGTQKSTVKKPKRVTITSVKSSKKGQITVKYKKLKKVSGYQISYSTNKKFKKAKSIKVKASVVKKTIKKLKSKKKYYVRVRAYTKKGSKKLYGSWSKVKKVKIK